MRKTSTLPGIYTLATPEQPESKPALAVNLPREESDLTPHRRRRKSRKRLGVENAHVAADLPALRRLIEEHRVGRTYGEHLLWLAFVLTAIEFVYANSPRARRQRARRKSDRGCRGPRANHAPLPDALPEA